MVESHLGRKLSFLNSLKTKARFQVGPGFDEYAFLFNKSRQQPENVTPTNY